MKRKTGGEEQKEWKEAEGCEPEGRNVFKASQKLPAEQQ